MPVDMSPALAAAVLDELKMGTTEVPALQKGGHADLMRLVNRLLGTVDADARARTLFDIIGVIAGAEDPGERQGLAFFAKVQTMLYMDNSLAAVTSLASPRGSTREQ
ncbi:MAG: hypothetical protein M3348_16015 [Acidobacteriota bacterium]|nr:hypothetical protein [Acidobacteriota bacterium]